MVHNLRPRLNVEAIQFSGSNFQEIQEWSNGAAERTTIPFSESSPERERPLLMKIDNKDQSLSYLKENDWIIKGITGLFFVVENDRIHELYESV